MPTPEIVTPETKPETEWVRGRALQKVSPQRNHARLQSELASVLNAWAVGRGEVGTEWRFRIAPPGEIRRPLVPDIAFVAAEKLRGLSIEEIQIPDFAPNVAIEILSPGDVRSDVDSKIDVYLSAGAELVMIVDPTSRSIELHHPHGKDVAGEAETLQHGALPGFTLSVGVYFETALRLVE